MKLSAPLSSLIALIALWVLAASAQATVNVNVTFENLSSSAQSNVPVTFGHIFAEGDVPTGSTIAAKLNGTTNIPIQVDHKATHRDGSLRHAIISMRIPSLPGNSVSVVTLHDVAAGSSPSAVTLSQLLATNFDAVITLNVGGTTYTASAKNLLSTASPQTWLSGAQAGEWIVGAPIRTAQNVAHPHLTAYFHVRAYAGMDSVRVSAIVENNWTFVPNPSNFTYDATVTVGGQQVYSKSNVTHYHHARWRKDFWWGKQPQVHVRHDIRYFKETLAVPNYDYSLNPPESGMASYYNSYQSSNHDIMGISFLQAKMGTAGGRPDIGPLPKWVVMYLLSMDSRMWEVTKGIADLAGTWSSHYRNEKTGLPVTVEDYPNITTHNNFLGQPDNPMNNCSNCNSPYVHEESHQPSMAYVPYMVTGDYYYLEELQFWATENLFFTSPNYRGYEKGYTHWMQVRGMAWTVRTFADAAYVTPDNHPLKNYFNNLIMNNIAKYSERYLNGGIRANSLGVITDGYALGYNGGRALSPWMDDFFTWSMGHVVELGFTEAIPMLQFKATFPVGRMTAPGYCWIDGSVYAMNVRDGSSSPFYSTFAEAYQASVGSEYWSVPCASQQYATLKKLAVGEMVGYSYSPEGYPSNMQPALAVAVDSGINNAVQAWEIFMSRSVKPDYSTYPNWDIVPRNYRKPKPPTNIQLSQQ